MKSVRTPGRLGSLQAFEITIEKVVYGGMGLGRHEGKVVFVPFSTAGDKLLVRVVQRKKNLIRASIERVLAPGPTRREPDCIHFGTCGGCQWQHMDYAAQVETKRLILQELFHHRFPETRKLGIGMKPSPEFLGYRSRARLQLRGFGKESLVGFYRFQSHDLVDVERCPLFQPSLNQALAAIREQWKEGKADPGAMQVELICSEQEGRWASSEIERDLEEGFSSLGKIEASAPNRPLLTRTIGEFEYQVAPQVFFQANDFMISELVSVVMESVAGAGHNSALDLFSGIGLFSLPLGRRFRNVTAVESAPEAGRMCRENAEGAGLENIRVVCADASAWMRTIAAVGAPGFDLIVLDPPRTGAGVTVMEQITDWAPKRIVYVSCDPQTLVRDLALLPERDYGIDSIQGLDLFPQTYHFETVVRLQRH